MLLVEDTRDGVTLTRHALRKAGIDLPLVVARNGSAALEALFPAEGAGDDDGAPPALVLLDLKMPGLDGLEVLERIRSGERTRTVPVVVLTSSHEPADVMAAYAMGADSYVRKPVRFENLVDVLGQVCGTLLGTRPGPPTHEAIVSPAGYDTRAPDRSGQRRARP